MNKGFLCRVPTVLAFSTSFRIPRILQYFLRNNIPTALPLYTEHYRAIYLQQYLYVYSSTAPYLHICSTSGQILAALPLNVQQYRAISPLRYLYMYSTTEQLIYSTTFLCASLQDNIPTVLPFYVEHYRAAYLQQHLFVNSATAQYLYIYSTTEQSTCSTTFIYTALPAI